MKISKSNNRIIIDQNIYIKDKLELYGFDNAKMSLTPSEVKSMSIINNNMMINIDNSVDNMCLSDSDINMYRGMVGSLIYASVSTRPDITHAVNMVSRYMTKPTKESMIMVKRIFRYLIGVPNIGLVYDSININENDSDSDTIIITGYCDADWGGDKNDRKSTTGYCTFINNNLISWCTKKQATVALSSTEAEYMAICEVAKEIMWLRILLKELFLNIKTPTIIYVDNQSAKRISENDTEHDRTKHIDIRHYFIRDLISNGEIKLEWVSTTEQIADIFTKSLNSSIFTTLRKKLMKI